MIAKTKILLNREAIEAAHKQNEGYSPACGVEKTPIPEPEMGEGEFLFHATAVTYAFINGEGSISMEYCGKTFNIIYDDSVWNELKQAFKSKK